MVGKRNKKGAFQLSLGFIIGLIFAVILLTLSIMWIRGVFNSFGTMTDDLTQNAKSQLANTFDNSQTNFDVSPSYYKLDPGKGVKLSAGIKNDADDATGHTFVIRVFPGTADSGIISNYKCNDFESCDELKNDMLSWVTYIKNKYKVLPNEKRYWDITMNFPDTIKKGDYMYDIVACKDMEWSECTRESTNWGQTKTLTLTAK
ncbi:MAG: hypothetical protein GXO64_01635 [Candidatus Micrarchaeota archaeon]|nr:hypothetical protein [Candidatus Micrarchaeota archaeon]